MSTRSFTDHILVPVADADDAQITAELLSSYTVGQVTVLHVVEKGEGVPDKTPVEQSEQIAEAAFETFLDVFPDAETEITYRRDVVGAIIDVAADVDASAIAFRPRSKSRILQFLAGDRTLDLITRADRPVITLTDSDND